MDEQIDNSPHAPAKAREREVFPWAFVPHGNAEIDAVMQACLSWCVVLHHAQHCNHTQSTCGGLHADCNRFFFSTAFYLTCFGVFITKSYTIEAAMILNYANLFI